MLKVQILKSCYFSNDSKVPTNPKFKVPTDPKKQ